MRFVELLQREISDTENNLADIGRTVIAFSRCLRRRQPARACRHVRLPGRRPRRLTNHLHQFTFCSVMSDAETPTHAPQTGAPPCADDADDWARALLERQLWMLGRLAEVGLEIAQAIERQATSDEARAVVSGDIPLAYARVARAVRLTLMLQSKVICELQSLERREAHEARCAQINADVARPRLERARKTRIQRIVGRVAWAQGEDGDGIERVMREAGEQLEQDDVYGDVLSRPVSELVALICRQLGLEPDWPQLAEEAWAQDEIAGGAAGAPLAAVMAGAADARRPMAATEPIRFTPHAASP